MQAINIPQSPASPITERIESGPEGPPKPARNLRPSGKVVAMVGAALTLVLVGLVIGSLPIGRPVAAGLPDAGLSGFAEMYVATLLTYAGDGAEDALAPYLGYSPDLTGLKPGTWYVTQTAVWSVEAAGPDAWMVLVAATQLGLEEGGYVPAGTFFYEVNVEQTPAGLRATALPNLVATPLSTAQSLRSTPDIDDRLTALVDEFLAKRFTDKGTGYFDTPPFATVIVRSVTPGESDADHLEIDVEFLGVDAAGRATPLAYQLRISTIDWSIVEAGDVNREAS